MSNNSRCVGDQSAPGRGTGGRVERANRCMHPVGAPAESIEPILDS